MLGPMGSLCTELVNVILEPLTGGDAELAAHAEAGIAAALGSGGTRERLAAALVVRRGLPGGRAGIEFVDTETCGPGPLFLQAEVRAACRRLAASARPVLVLAGLRRGKAREQALEVAEAVARSALSPKAQVRILAA
jgi:hypothetical protein